MRGLLVLLALVFAASAQLVSLWGNSANGLAALQNYASPASKRRAVSFIQDDSDFGEINPSYAVALENLALTYSRGTDNISQKYANFNSPLSYSSGALGVLNLTVTGNFFLGGTNLGLIVPDVFALLEQVATPDLTYIETGIAGGFPYTLQVDGIVNISLALVAAGLLEPKLYGQTQFASAFSFKQLDSKTYQVASTQNDYGLVASLGCEITPGCYPKSATDPNLQWFANTGFQILQFTRSGSNFLISSIYSQGRYASRSNSLPDPTSLNFAPFVF